MIEGLGLDIVEVSRIAEAMQRDGFLERVLTPAERGLGLTPERVAGRWAAKEALAKALGMKLSWQDVEILNAPDGRPVVAVQGLGDDLRVHVSISHERGLAVATAIVERDPL